MQHDGWVDGRWPMCIGVWLRYGDVGCRWPARWLRPALRRARWPGAARTEDGPNETQTGAIDRCTQQRTVNATNTTLGCGYVA
eukprot:6649207-Prymnesium_polylepis.1